MAVAKDNRLREVKVEAPRGVVYDRNGKILVENRAGLSVGLLPMDMYDPKKEPEKFQQEIDGLARILDVTETDLMAAYEKAKKDPYVTYIVKEDVPENTIVAYIKEHSLEFQGVQVEASYSAPVSLRGAGHPRAGLRGGGLPERSRSTRSSPRSGPARPSARTASSGNTTPSCGARTAGRRWRSTRPAGPSGSSRIGAPRRGATWC